METSSLKPFGLKLEANRPLSELSAPEVKDLLLEHQVLVFKGIPDPSDEEMLSFCEQMGEILHWSFGPINELKADPQAKNYIYTNSAVPFHWDGAFVRRVPFGVFFHCRQAGPPESGGATLFSNTHHILRDATAAQKERWKACSITYSTEKLVHYGGSFSSDVLCQHPHTEREILRYAEPVEDLNPVHLTIEGLEGQSPEEFVKDMRELLYDPRYCLSHSWTPGDVVLADNHTLLHGRAEYKEEAPRHLRRINVL